MNSKKMTRIMLVVALVILTAVLVSVVPVKAVVYNAAFDSDYYMNRYPDIKAAFEGDPDGALMVAEYKLTIIILIKELKKEELLQCQKH